MRAASSVDRPLLPPARGPVSDVVIDCLRRNREAAVISYDRIVCLSEAWSDDAMLALVVLHELHYRGWHGVDSERCSDRHLTKIRLLLEDRFFTKVSSRYCGARSSTRGVPSTEPAHSSGGDAFLALDGYLAEVADLREFADYFAVGSLLSPRGSSSQREVFDGVLESFGLDTGYLAYLPTAPAAALGSLVLTDCVRIRPTWRGAAVGRATAAEVNASTRSAGILLGLQRLGAADAAIHRYLAQLQGQAGPSGDVRRTGLDTFEPGEQEVVAGRRAQQTVEERLSIAFRDAWRRGRTLVT
ncbi:hypothetical protein [Gordonia sihwensis]|uniref:hypothetical protein n=1 Tax=Gordonia TaxID=2053 RepID=UPI0024171BB7|nr:hypothetical protein [Gordonia sihwensis]WFN92884.1 hypothetical protein P5P27_19445 [Gordonia sihwensis]